MIGDDIALQTSESTSTGSANTVLTYENKSTAPKITFKMPLSLFGGRVSIGLTYENGSFTGFAGGLDTPWISTNGGFSKNYWFQEFSYKSGIQSNSIGLEYHVNPKPTPQLKPLPLPFPAPVRSWGFGFGL